MPVLPTWTEILTWAWDNKELISDKLKELYGWFRSSGAKPSQRGILILGAGGVGKTTLARLLSGSFSISNVTR